MAFTGMIVGMRLVAESPLASVAFAVNINPPPGSEHIDNFDAVGVRVLAHSDLATLNSFPFSNNPAPAPQEIFRWQPASLIGGQEYRLNTTSFVVPAGTVALSAAPIFRDVDEGWKYFDDMLVRSRLGGSVINGFVPEEREGAYTIKDFTVMTGIERLQSGLFVVHDIDFVNTQLLSMLQGANKMRRIASGTDPNFTLQFRPRSGRNDEYTARRGASFRACLNESARIIEFAVEEVRNKQRFMLENVQFSRTIVR
jgi:hypothetical protein